MLLKASLVLAAPLLMAYGSDDNAASSGASFSFGAEVQGHSVTASWHPVTTAKTKNISKLTAALSNASGWSYQEGGAKLPNFTFGGRVLGKSNFSDDFSLLVSFGFESGMKDAKTYKNLNIGTATAGASVTEDVTTANWDLQDTTGTATIKNDMVMVPGIYLGYGNVFVGATYDMRSYTFGGADTGLTSYLNGDVKDSQPLFGFRAEQPYMLDDMTLVLSFEYMSNLGRSAKDEMKTHWLNVAKYGVDGTITEVSSNVVTNGDFDMGDTPDTYVQPTDRGAVASVNSLIQKASIGLGVFIFDL